MSAWPKAALRCDFPDPLGPNNRIVPPRSIHPSPVASAATCARLSMGTAVKSKLSSVFAGWQAGLKQMSLDTSLIPFGELQLGEGRQQSCRRPTFAIGAFSETLPHRG